MTRKAIIWIVIGVLALALVAIGAVAFGVRSAASSVAIAQVRPSALRSSSARIMPGGMVGPLGQLRGNSYILRVGGGQAFLGLRLLFALLIGAGIGALIVYLIGPGRHQAAVAAGPSGTRDPQYQQFVEWQRWQQFELWHRRMHAATSEEPTMPMMQPRGETLSSEPTPPNATAEG